MTHWSAWSPRQLNYNVLVFTHFYAMVMYQFAQWILSAHLVMFPETTDTFFWTPCGHWTPQIHPWVLHLLTSWQRWEITLFLCILAASFTIESSQLKIFWNGFMSDFRTLEIIAGCMQQWIQSWGGQRKHIPSSVKWVFYLLHECRRTIFVHPYLKYQDIFQICYSRDQVVVGTIVFHCNVKFTK